ncbi:4a-hydroxytetrahydrobiopterin dehydratase [Bacillaceae bacterium]
MKLGEEQIARYLSQREGWQRQDEKWIAKKYRFREFLDGIRFVNRVAEIAETMNHHPFISIEYKVVTLRLTTWKKGGLTELDFASAAEYDRAYAQLQR